MKIPDYQIQNVLRLYFRQMGEGKILEKPGRFAMRSAPPPSVASEWTRDIRCTGAPFWTSRMEPPMHRYRYLQGNVASNVDTLTRLSALNTAAPPLTVTGIS